MGFKWAVDQCFQWKIKLLASRDESPIRVSQGNGYANGTSGRLEHSTVNGNSHDQESIQNGHSSDQHSDDEYIDTVEVRMFRVHPFPVFYPCFPYPMLFHFTCFFTLRLLSFRTTFICLENQLSRTVHPDQPLDVHSPTTIRKLEKYVDNFEFLFSDLLCYKILNLLR